MFHHSIIIINNNNKFPYNARSDWLKQGAFLGTTEHKLVALSWLWNFNFAAEFSSVLLRQTQCERVICKQLSVTIVNNCKTARKWQILLDSDKARSEINKFSTSRWFDERQKLLYLRSKATKENTNWATSVYDEKLYLSKNSQATLTCYVVKLVTIVAIDGHFSEVTTINNLVSSLTQLVMSWKLALTFSSVLAVERMGAA